jgi:asparagine synthase (glutamine-hydrolysing)
MGFPVPLAGWFRGVLKESIYEILLGRRSTARGIFRPEAVRAVLDEHVSGRSNLESHVWILVVFEIWCRLFVDGERFDQISLV